MKVAITGASHGLGEGLVNYFSTNNHSVLELRERIVNYQYNIVEKLEDSDVFINCSNSGDLQATLYTQVYQAWKMQNKTIVNILTSGIFYGSPNKIYLKSKQEFNDLIIQTRDLDKTVRILNIYPNTLENNVNNFPKVKFDEVASTIEAAINLPQDLELFAIGISRSNTNPKNNVI